MIKRKRKILSSYLWFVLPAIIVYSVFIIYPMIGSFYFGMTNWDGISPTMDFVGLKNFQRLVQDEKVLNAMTVTFKVVIMSVVLQNILGLVFAFILDSSIKTKNVLRTLILLPVAISPLVVSFIWSYMYNYDMGAINKVLDTLHLSMLKQDWLGNTDLAIYAVAWVTIWQWFGFQMIIYLAALQGVPQEMLEAARVDGAKPWQRITNIILPVMAPAFTINVVLCTIGGLKTFDTVFAMTNGGPGYATETIAMKMYTEAFTNNRMGYGAAIGLILFIIIMAITICQVRLLKQREIDL